MSSVVKPRGALLVRNNLNCDIFLIFSFSLPSDILNHFTAWRDANSIFYSTIWHTLRISQNYIYIYIEREREMNILGGSFLALNVFVHLLFLSCVCFQPLFRPRFLKTTPGFLVLHTKIIA